MADRSVSKLRAGTGRYGNCKTPSPLKAVLTSESALGTGRDGSEAVGRCARWSGKRARA